MGRTTDLRRAIEAKFLPLMTVKGFSPDFRHMPTFMVFRKIADNKIYVCDIQWEKYGRPRFPKFRKLRAARHSLFWKRS
jgi:hypothetical protein